VTPDDILAAVKGYLSVFERPLTTGERKPQRLTTGEREAALRLALDRLALASHFAATPFDDEDHADPPGEGYDELRARIAPLFPELGLYNVARDLETNVGATEVLVGDAIDDIVDIARDLSDVARRWETTSVADALWHFRFGFRSHWGQHLRSLQLYLHARAYWPA
jgi:hypothetical protein